MKISLEENIINTMDKDSLNEEESIDFLEDIYWADWHVLSEQYKEYIPKIFNYLRNEDHSFEGVSQIIKLYNNPHGAYIEEFSDIIIGLYNKDKIEFIRALNIDRDEISNLVYLFRNNNIEIDKDEELLKIIKSDLLTEEEKETGEFFIKMYHNVCNT